MFDIGLRTAADHAPCIIWSANADGGWTYVNAAWTRLCGQDADEALGHAWMNAVPQAERDAVRHAYVEGVLSAQPFEIAHGLRTAAGAQVHVTTRVHPEFRGDNQLLGFAGSCSRCEEAPVADGEFRSLVENSPDVIARFDRGMRHLYINRAARDWFGIDAASSIGKTIAEVGLPAGVTASYVEVAEDVFEHGVQRTFDFMIEAGARPRHFNTRIVPEFGSQGHVDSVLAVTYDVTQQTLAQLERDASLIREQAARVQAEAAAKARDQFLAIVSHELRSPLNGIQSWTHVLENRVDPESPSIARAISGIKLGVQQQVRLIEDLLDATQVMTGKLRLIKQDFLLRPTIESAIESVTKPAYERGITIRTAFPAAQTRLLGNAERVEQIVWNLLTNAIKFSPPGGTVDVGVEAGESDITITVRDTGKGITTEFMPYLFDPFRQADGSNTRRAEGLGLGLTLAQRLAELHGGKITAHSDGENQGSLFSVVLPLAAGEEDEDADVPKAVQPDQTKSLTSLAGVRVLLVDDQKEARDSLTELLQQTGAQVMPLESGIRAVEYMKVIQADGVPHVIVCDIAMPGQDGYLTLQKIRRLESLDGARFRTPVPAIALTAFGQREDRLKALASGFQVYLAKPANPTELVTIIEMLTRQPGEEAEPAVTEASRPAKKAAGASRGAH